MNICPFKGGHLNLLFEFYDILFSCGHRPQRIMGSLQLQEIICWPKEPAKYLLLPRGLQHNIEVILMLRGESNPLRQREILHFCPKITFINISSHIPAYIHARIIDDKSIHMYFDLRSLSMGSL